MANVTLKEIKDIGDGKHDIDAKRYSEIFKVPELPDPIGPRKYDVPDRILRSYLDLLPRVTQTLDAVVDHLEHGAPEGKPFVRPDQRPEVGVEAINDLVATVSLLSERVSKLEGRRRK